MSDADYGDDGSTGLGIDPKTAQKLAYLLKQQQPYGQTPFAGAANAGSNLLNAYLAKTLQQHAMPQMMSQSLPPVGQFRPKPITNLFSYGPPVS